MEKRSSQFAKRVDKATVQKQKRKKKNANS
jgi:hypothetical protein